MVSYLSLFYIYQMFLGENEDFLEETQLPMVQNILETGVDRNIVMQKIKRRARERGLLKGLRLRRFCRFITCN